MKIKLKSTLMRKYQSKITTEQFVNSDDVAIQHAACLSEILGNDAKSTTI